MNDGKFERWLADNAPKNFLAMHGQSSQRALDDWLQRPVKEDEKSATRRSGRTLHSQTIVPKWYANKCILTGNKVVEACHIVPDCIERHESCADEFWIAIMTFWPPKQVNELQGLLQEPDHEKTNLLVLDATSHAFWDKCLFALRPLKFDPELPSLRLQFFWIDPVRTNTKVLDYTGNKAENGTICDNRDADSLMSRNIQSGDVFLITTRDNKEYPLPDHRLLELQWHLQRAARATASAGFLRFIFGHDQDSTKVPGSSDIHIDFDEAEFGPPGSFEPFPHFSEYLINSALELGIIHESGVQFWRDELISPEVEDEDANAKVHLTNLGMPTCDICSPTIQKLHQHRQSLRSGRAIVIALPSFRHANGHNCWIYFKFSVWLKTEHHDLFQDLHRQLLPVTFSVVDGIHFQEPKPDVLLPFFLQIALQGHGRSNDSCRIDLNFIPAKDLVAHPIVAPERRLSADADHILLKTWIDTCQRHHKKCNKNYESWYPRRLLYIEHPSRKVRLIISKDHLPNGAYMTLSYRWGSQRYTKLESSTMAQLQSAVDVPNLPQVLQDTIQIAYDLGIKYLWIDALCIKQDPDNTSDWEIEAQNMDKIYSCAFLNVSATFSSDSSESLFQERPRDPILPLQVDLDINGTEQTCYVLNDSIWDEEITHAPLNKRGWVFQERFLARRVLHFGQQQMAWECRELSTLEMFPNGLPQPCTLSFSGKSDADDKLSAFTGQSDLTLDHFVDAWQDLVANYSKCRLTYPKDKLVAFLGVAKRIQGSGMDHYAAGMWQESMVYDLPWWRTSDDRKAFPISQTSSRAPSWSWASVDGEINFPAVYRGQRHPLTNILEISQPGSGSGACARSISIRVEGVCLPFSAMWSGEDIANFKVDGLDFSIENDFGDAAVDLEVSEQEMQEWVQHGSVLLLPLFASGYSLHGILLRKIDGAGTYCRIGAAEISIKRDFPPSPDTLGETKSVGTQSAEPPRSRSDILVDVALDSQAETWQSLQDKNAAILGQNILQRLKAGHTRIIDVY